MNTSVDIISLILEECKNYPGISFRELAQHDFPDDSFMIEDCKDWQEEQRYEVIASMSKEYKTNVYRGEYFG